MTDLANLTNAKLAKEIERRMTTWHKASGGVFALTIDSHNERFSQILARLGDGHPAVVAYQAANGARDEAEYEARRRLGPVPHYSLVIYLERSPRYRPVA